MHPLKATESIYFKMIHFSNAKNIILNQDSIIFIVFMKKHLFDYTLLFGIHGSWICIIYIIFNCIFIIQESVADN